MPPNLGVEDEGGLHQPVWVTRIQAGFPSWKWVVENLEVIDSCYSKTETFFFGCLIFFEYTLLVPKEPQQMMDIFKE